MGIPERGSGSNVIIVIAKRSVALTGLLVLAFVVATSAINSCSSRSASGGASSETKTKTASSVSGNLLVAGVESSASVGFLAIRVDANERRVFGIAVPDGAFIDVPGQGFMRIGEAYPQGMGIVANAISNYLGVAFDEYVVVSREAYQSALTGQDVSGLLSQVQGSNIADQRQAGFAQAFQRVASKDVALVPLPVKPINLGEQTYLEPQKSEVADLLSSWWGVSAVDTEQMTRVALYNGAGTPGIAGDAAQQLIRAGFRVVDTQNADRFDYKTTTIVVKRGPVGRGEAVREALGCGVVKSEPSEQDVVDVVVIVGKDFVPEGSDTSKE